MKPKKEKIQSELNEKIWGIITATHVVCKNKTYAQCVTIYETSNLDPNDATIVTNDAIARMEKNL